MRKLRIQRIFRIGWGDEPSPTARPANLPVMQHHRPDPRATWLSSPHLYEPDRIRLLCDLRDALAWVEDRHGAGLEVLVERYDTQPAGELARARVRDRPDASRDLEAALTAMVWRIRDVGTRDGWQASFPSTSGMRPKARRAAVKQVEMIMERT